MRKWLPKQLLVLGKRLGGQQLAITKLLVGFAPPPPLQMPSGTKGVCNGCQTNLEVVVQMRTIACAGAQSLHGFAGAELHRL